MVPVMFYSTAADSWAMLASVLLFTGLLGAFLLVVSGRTTKIERLVEQRTAELRLGRRCCARLMTNWNRGSQIGLPN